MPVTKGISYETRSKYSIPSIPILLLYNNVSDKDSTRVRIHAFALILVNSEIVSSELVYRHSD